MPMPPDFRPRQIYEQVADQIRTGIASGAYPPGSRLPSERDLAQRLTVSRPAVREAIGALQNAGLVFTRHGSGTYVSEAMPAALPVAEAPLPDEPDAGPISTLQARMLVEPAIARLAARRGKRDAAAERYLDRMLGVQDITDLQQQEIWSESDRLFHRQIAWMTGSPLLIKIANAVADTMDQPLWKRLRDDGIYAPSRIQLYVAEHRMIYEAIVAGDPDAAGFYVLEHLKRVERDISTHE